MSVLKAAAQKLSLLASLALVVGSMACAGADGQPAYANTDITEAELASTAQPLRCESGAVQSCTIWLGQHGDLANCAHGLDICANGSWTGCVDDETLSESPELYADLAGE